MSFLSAGAKAKYGPVFETLSADLQQVVPTWSQPSLGTLNEAFAEYAIVTTGASSRSVFLIYFVKDLDGIWRIDSM